MQGSNVTSYSTDAIVVGAGVVGLAIARQLSLRGLDTILVEQESNYGSGISSRNSEVIHSGLYYKKDSLKAKFCVEGNRLLYDYCLRAGIEHQRLGKLIVATTEHELDTLHQYLQHGKANGVHDLDILNASQLRDLEPELSALGAILSPSTGIVDSHGLMTSFLGDFENAGGAYVRGSPVDAASVSGTDIEVSIGGSDPCRMRTKYLVNSAGLGAQKFARSIEGFPQSLVPSLHYAIGHYYTLSGHSPFRHLIYPVASGGGLGVHLTLDLQGRARFGPDISWREAEDYTFDDTRAESFAAAVQRYWPGLDMARLAPAYTGIRPKLWGPDCPDQDFLIQGPAIHNVNGLVNLFGIESPGLTSALSIALHVSEILET